jgi:hypothetical protein
LTGVVLTGVAILTGDTTGVAQIVVAKLRLDDDDDDDEEEEEDEDEEDEEDSPACGDDSRNSDASGETSEKTLGFVEGLVLFDPSP